MNYSDPVQSPRNTVLERLKISLAVLITNSEFITITNVVQRHNRYFEPSIEYIMSQRGFHNYVQLFECFPNSFKLSDDQQSVTFLRTAPPQSVLPYTHIVEYASNIKKRAWNNIIKVRELATNHAIHEPLRVNDFIDVIIPDRILLNLRRMNITRLTNIQQYILPYLFNGKNDLLIEGTKVIGRTIGVLTSLLSQIHMFKHIQKVRRGPLAVILLQSSPFEYNTHFDTSQSNLFADKFSKTLFLLSEHLNITTGFDSIDITKDICVITFKDIREYEEKTLQYLQFFIAFNVEQIISKVGHDIFCARIGAFAPKDAATIFVMEDYHDPGPVMLRDCFKEDAIFISDKT